MAYASIVVATYQWVIQERGGGASADLPHLTERAFSLPLNRPPNARAKMAYTASPEARRLLESGTSELVIYRNGRPVETVFELADSALVGDSNTEQYELAWLGIMAYLQRGLVLAGETQSSIAQSRIVWDLIDTFQTRTGASTFGLLDYGAPGTDPTKSVTYEEDTDLLDAIIALSERASGFDFGVDAGRRFRCYYPERGEDRNGEVVFEYGVNVDTYNVNFDTSPGEIVTDVRVKGGDENITTVTATDATAQAKYGRREASIQYSDVITQTAALQNFADQVVADRAAPAAIPSLTLTRDHPSIPWGSYWLGDTVLVRIPSAGIDRGFRIVQINVELDENDNETISVDLNEAT